MNRYSSQGTSDKAASKAGTSRPRPPRIQPVRKSPHLRGLHKALRDAIPALRGVIPLSSKQLDEDFHRALSCQQASDFKYWYLEANLLKRYMGSDLSDKEARVTNALEKLMDSEVRCAETNKVFAGGIEFSNSAIPLHLLSRLKRARRILHRLLGEFDINKLPEACDFSPGATSELPRKEAALHNKWARAAHVTARAQPYAEAFLIWAGLPDLCRDLVVTNANVVFTVPKNFERDRTAAKPVTWNAFFQKGLGTLIKRRLQRYEKLLLPDAQEYHRVLAKLGSAIGALCTRDLASASDCVATNLVLALAPPSWSEALMDTREPHGIIPGSPKQVVWEKISSMGNGYTFELETAIFYSLVRACCSGKSLVSVYGDDIVFPARYAESVDELLSFCGFEINREKSFSTESQFRESCGGHYFAGQDVKPFYVTHLPSTLSDVINLHNDIVRWHQGIPSSGTRWHPVWAACRQIIPRVFWGPPGVQGVAWAEWDECTPTYEPDFQAFRIGVVTRAIDRTEDLSGAVGADGISVVKSAHIGAYLQKLWQCDPLPWESSEVSKYQTTGTRERSSWLYVDRGQWNRLTAETLCN